MSSETLFPLDFVNQSYYQFCNSLINNICFLEKTSVICDINSSEIIVSKLDIYHFMKIIRIFSKRVLFWYDAHGHQIIFYMDITLLNFWLCKIEYIYRDPQNLFYSKLYTILNNNNNNSWFILLNLSHEVNLQQNELLLVCIYYVERMLLQREKIAYGFL